MDMRRWGKSRICGREPHELLRPFRTLRLILGSVVFISSLLIFTLPSQSSCRDPDVARGFGSLAYAANVDATIQYFGHSFFLITTSKGTRIVTDPLGPGWYPNPNVIGDVVTVGKEMYNHNAVEIVLGKPLILRGLKNYGADWNNSQHELQRHAYLQRADPSKRRIRRRHPRLGLRLRPGNPVHRPSGRLEPKTQRATDQSPSARSTSRSRPSAAAAPWDRISPEKFLAQLKPKIAIPMHHRDSPYLINSSAPA